MKRLSFILVSLFLFSSCDLIVEGFKSIKLIKEETQKENKPDAEIATPNVKNGVKKYHFKTGELKSIVTYKDNKKVGVSETFYKSGEKQYDIPYVDGMKHGAVKWYYKDGKVYRETEYIKGKKSGFQKKYWENKKLKSQTKYFENLLCLGLKEFNKKGIEKKVPYVTVEKQNLVSAKNKYILKFRLSNGRKKVKFFIGKLIDGKFFPENGGRGFSELEVKAGVGTMEISVPKGFNIDKTVNIIAVESTVYQNKRLLKKSVAISVRN